MFWVRKSISCSKCSFLLCLKDSFRKKIYKITRFLLLRKNSSTKSRNLIQLFCYVASKQSKVSKRPKLFTFLLSNCRSFLNCQKSNFLSLLIINGYLGNDRTYVWHKRVQRVDQFDPRFSNFRRNVQI
jgi:hypothetical protein